MLGYLLVEKNAKNFRLHDFSWKEILKKRCFYRQFLSSISYTSELGLYTGSMDSKFYKLFIGYS